MTPRDKTIIVCVILLGLIACLSSIRWILADIRAERAEKKATKLFAISASMAAYMEMHGLRLPDPHTDREYGNLLAQMYDECQEDPL